MGGEVHALVGENGAGKSTLIKVLGGRLLPDSGDVADQGARDRAARPREARALGIETVFQELMLFPGLTVAENLLLGREPRGRFGPISRRRTGQPAEALLASVGITHIDPLALIEDISLAQRQIVEIVRALSREPDILFLDEPTSSLVEREVAWLFERVRALRDTGAAVVFTSHRWHEVTAIADRITVFRNGRNVGTFTELDEDAGGHADDRPHARREVPAAAARAGRAGAEVERPAGGRASGRQLRRCAAARSSASAGWPARGIASCSSCCSAPSAAARRTHRDRRPAGAHPQPARGQGPRHRPRAACRRTARPRGCCWR